MFDGPTCTAVVILWWTLSLYRCSLFTLDLHSSDEFLWWNSGICIAVVYLCSFFSSYVIFFAQMRHFNVYIIIWMFLFWNEMLFVIKLLVKVYTARKERAPVFAFSSSFFVKLVPLMLKIYVSQVALSGSLTFCGLNYAQCKRLCCKCMWSVTRLSHFYHLILIILKKNLPLRKCWYYF